MQWTIQQHKRGNGKQEIQVSLLVKDMQDTWANDTETWASAFKDKLKEIALWDSNKLAQLTVDSGLADWVINIAPV